MYGCVQDCSIIMTLIDPSSLVSSSKSSSAIGSLGGVAPESVAALVFFSAAFGLMERSPMRSRNTPGGMGAQVEPMLASVSASSLLS